MISPHYFKHILHHLIVFRVNAEKYNATFDLIVCVFPVFSLQAFLVSSPRGALPCHRVGSPSAWGHLLILQSVTCSCASIVSVLILSVLSRNWADVFTCDALCLDSRFLISFCFPSN